MRFPLRLLFLLAPFSPLSFASAQVPTGPQPSAVQTLRNARRTFAALDTNSDGRLDASELASSPITTPDHAAFDHDGDGAFSPDEFLAFYSHLLVASGQGLGPELATEITRIRRARQAEDERVGGQGRGATPSPDDAARRSRGRTVADRLEQARRALEASVSARAATDSAQRGRASERPSGASGRSVGEQLERAWGALDTPARDAGEAAGPPPSGLEARDHVAERLERARAAIGG